LRDKPGFTVIDVRGDLQAVSQDDLQHALSCGEAFVEGNPFIGLVLLHQLRSPETQAVSAFMAPLSKDEIRFLQSVQPAISLSNFVADVMRRKLLRRAQRQKGVLAEVDLAEVERRAMSAYAEMKLACQFDYVLPNHDGEDSDNWDAFYFPVGDARRALLAFRALVEGTEPRDAERWEPDLLA
jgi:guanylate kinase